MRGEGACDEENDVLTKSPVVNERNKEIEKENVNRTNIRQNTNKNDKDRTPKKAVGKTRRIHVSGLS